MKLVVGLGNPGKKYEGTRHNVGFDLVGLLAKRLGAGRPKTQFQGEIWEVRLGGDRGWLLCPHTFMNLSGGSVLAARDFFKLENTDILVACDDFNLPLARMRIRAAGSAGGQKGLADIIRRLGTDSVPRLRIGIGPPPTGWDVADYVLSRFGSAERTEMEIGIQVAADAVELWAREGIAFCMNRFNSSEKPDA